MSASRLSPIAMLMAGLSVTAGMATNVDLATIEQPVNLGADSDPARIPLGKVGVTSNYNYGIHRMIGEARAFPDGAMKWDGGSEFDQNLASVFGISVNPEDSTNVPGTPVILNVKPWKPPGYSPYTKDQVLAATLWCVVRSAGGTPKRPLEIRVLAEAREDKHLEAKYSGKYVTHPDHGDKEVQPTKVAGTILEEDARGITWVVFPGVPRNGESKAPSPGFAIMEYEGDGNHGWHLLPVWGSGKIDPLALGTWSAPLLYSAYKSRGVTEANSFLAGGGSHYFDVGRTEAGDSFTIGIPHVQEATLAAEILALVIAAPTHRGKTLTVTIRLEEYNLASFPAFRGAPGWKETKHSKSNITLTCEFAWDGSGKKLTKGSVPLVERKGSLWISRIRDPKPDGEAATALAATVGQRIKQGLHDGTLLAEQNMADTILAKSGLPRELGKAGFYAAMATYSNDERLPDKPPGAPVTLGHYIPDQYFRAGWNIGLGRAEAIAIEVRKQMEVTGAGESVLPSPE
ncbi:hypothetical protein HZ994_12505 [Akkermansiaceae bacterium]|nr:hypothetical protein HZ994_12505 [Akkermansiaceae bacterium]